MSFFFPYATYKRAFSINRSIDSRYYLEELAYAEYYNFELHKYWGLGFILSFIPGTSAYRARKILATIVKSHLGDLVNLNIHLNNHTIFYKKACDAVVQGGILNQLLAPIWQVIDECYRYVSITVKDESGKLTRMFNWSNHDYPQVLPFYESDYFDNNKPIFFKRRSYRYSNIYDALKNYTPEDLIKTLLNPLRVLDNLLMLIHKFISAKVIGETTSKLIHGPVTMIFWLVLMPIKIVKKIADIPFLILKNFVYSPFAFLYSAFSQNLSDKQRQQYTGVDSIVRGITLLINSIQPKIVNIYNYNSREWESRSLCIELFLPILLIHGTYQNIDQQVDDAMKITDDRARFYKMLEVLSPGLSTYSPLRYQFSDTPDDKVMPAFEKLKKAIEDIAEKLTPAQVQLIEEVDDDRLHSYTLEQKLLVSIIRKIDPSSSMTWLYQGMLNHPTHDPAILQNYARTLEGLTKKIEEAAARLNSKVRFAELEALLDFTIPKPKATPESNSQPKREKPMPRDHHKPQAAPEFKSRPRQKESKGKSQYDSNNRFFPGDAKNGQDTKINDARALFGLQNNDPIDPKVIGKLRNRMFRDIMKSNDSDNGKQERIQTLNSAYDLLCPELHDHNMQYGKNPWE